MTIRPDNRLDDAPMQQVRCGRCDGEVLVRKSSWEQTSIQWSGRARSGCPNLASDRYATCPDLRSAIQQAALNGIVKVVDE